MNDLPGYDAWKLENPDEATAAEEAALMDRDFEQERDLREQIAANLEDYRGDLYLATIRKIVVEELNKLLPTAGEPLWQTAEAVKLPPYVNI